MSEFKVRTLVELTVNGKTIMKKIKSISVLAIIALTMQLSSCCYGIICDCFDDTDATIGLTFNIDSTNTSGFKRSEIENAIFIKYNKSGQAIDTSRLRNYGSYFEYYFNITNYMVQDSCTYRVKNETGNVDLLISDISFKGDYGGGCCDCYVNERISFKVNGEQQNFEGKDKGWARYAINKK